ncbi:type VI secretion system contractile sheath small subunit [Neptunicella marina]|uniref:Type VI secretion system contractile sheath small subunit n=1 Tax=Neptunicella marina TaxID=2125989 RepID=A0A8J6IVK1_9ALTE|nr:type VI secretion system contractile sheath small subunit [Neptunicella marina]MBC3766682.1 type VI secretion system contractile sheath small subunit [Neptunicella marina]
MAKEGSVAPKERVNIKYSPATGDAQEEVELPLKLLMMGDYTLRNDDTPVEERTPISVDKDNFNKVMEGQNLSLDVLVDNKLTGEDDAEMALNLKFKNLKDFEPENVVRQVPELNQMLEMREALTALKGPLGNVPAFRKKLEEALTDEEARNKLLAELKLNNTDTDA